MAHRVLFVALNWGLGHTTRIIPVMQAFRRIGCIVLFGGGRVQQKLIKESLPETVCLDYPALTIRFSRRSDLVLPILWQMPRFLLHLCTENRRLRKIVRTEKPDLIVSDNVYGAYHSKVPSVILTHQPLVLLPPIISVLSGTLNRLIKHLLAKHKQIWVPDLPEVPNLAGRMSHPLNFPHSLRYIGILSRFSIPRNSIRPTKGRILVLLSGPEPQRTIFERKVLASRDQLPEDCHIILVRGLPNENENPSDNIFNHLPFEELQKLIIESEIVICRAGYSSILDLITLQKNAVLVPTPGQTEQEYLAGKLADDQLFISLSQAEFSLPLAVEKFREAVFNPVKILSGPQSKKLLAAAIEDVVDELLPEK